VLVTHVKAQFHEIWFIGQPYLDTSSSLRTASRQESKTSLFAVSLSTDWTMTCTFFFDTIIDFVSSWNRVDFSFSLSLPAMQNKLKCLCLERLARKFYYLQVRREMAHLTAPQNMGMFVVTSFIYSIKSSLGKKNIHNGNSCLGSLGNGTTDNYFYLLSRCPRSQGRKLHLVKPSNNVFEQITRKTCQLQTLELICANVIDGKENTFSYHSTPDRSST